MVEWWKNITDFKITGENPALKSCPCSATAKCHLYYNVDIERHYV